MTVDDESADTVDPETAADERVVAEDKLEVDVMLLLVVVGRIWYSSSRFPFPQYWYGFPGQIMLQSTGGAGTELTSRVLPQ